MTILVSCRISGIQFPVAFGVSSSRYAAEDTTHCQHPVFSLPLKTLYHLAEDSKQTLLDPKDRGLLHLALMNATGLVQYQIPASLPTALDSALYLERTLAILHWLEFRGKSRDLPQFNCTRESRNNLYSGFLKELELFRENLETRRRANDIQHLATALDSKLSRRETYGLKLITPDVATKVCELIQWSDNDIPHAKQYLLADAHSVIKMLDSGDLDLIDLANLMLDIEILDWTGRTRDTVLAHLRGLVNMLHTVMGFTAAQKELFTDTIEPVTDFLDGLSFGTNAKTGPKFEVLATDEPQEDLSQIKPLSIRDRIKARGIQI